MTRLRPETAAWAARVRAGDEACGYCNIPLALLPLHDRTVDHLVPLSRGGSRERCNLVAACKACNVIKGDRLVSEMPIHHAVYLRSVYRHLVLAYLSEPSVADLVEWVERDTCRPMEPQAIGPVIAAEFLRRVAGRLSMRGEGGDRTRARGVQRQIAALKKKFRRLA